MNYSRIANKFLNQIPTNSKQNRRKLSMSDFEEFWKDAEEYKFHLHIRDIANSSNEHRNHSVDLKQNFHTPAFTTKLNFEHSEKSKGSKSFHTLEHNDRYENRKEDYATCKLYFT